MTNSKPSLLTAEVGRIVAGLMARYNVTQKQMADSVGVSQSQLSKMLRGERSIDLDQLDVMAAGFEKTAVQILAEAEELVDEMQGPIDGTVFFVENGLRVPEPRVWGNVRAARDTETQDDYARAARKRSKDRGWDTE
ncbi:MULTISPECIES: helix-turn-helix domain-containing protein [unclassified Microbacterium]|uniref:helix-turn-helix domain-containing protein n=1 Tax=unclassified Microbacterium TaxID=2609290 RepID=UPI00300FEB05